MGDKDKISLTQIEKNLIIHSLFCYIEHYYTSRRQEYDDIYEIITKLIKKIGV